MGVADFPSPLGRRWSDGPDEELAARIERAEVPHLPLRGILSRTGRRKHNNYTATKTNGEFFQSMNT